ncbi:MAG: amidohydrolase family protein [Alphaproteobacteria bacterium]|nr:amidohydrolase family protein [Alphaproteobacteria bacterium]
MAGERCDILIRNAYVLTCDAKRTKHPQGAVAVTGKTIAAVGPSADIEARFKAARVLDAGGGVVHPGLIDMHYHVTQHMIGKMIQEVELKGDPGAWIARQYTGMNNALDEESEWCNGALAALDMLKNGITAFMEPGTVYSTDAVADALTAVGVRASLADAWLVDSEDPAFTQIRGVVPTAAHCIKTMGGQLWRNKDAEAKIRGHVAIYGCNGNSLEVIRAGKALAEKNGVPFNMHQSQSTDDAGADDARLGKHPLVKYEEDGLLSPACVFVHMNVLRDDEIDPILRSGMSIVWSTTNTWYYATRTRARNRIPELARKGANVTLGLDVSKAASFGDQAYSAYLLARDQGDYLSPEDILQMQTLNAAKAMRLADRLGSLEAGKRADIVMHSSDRPEAWPRQNRERQTVILARGKTVDTVLVDGEILMKGGRHTGLDEGALYARCDAAATGLRERAGLG